MCAQLYLTGQDEQNSELDLLLNDSLYGMGDAVTKEQGSLAWCESMAIANCQMASLNFIRLISNQFTPQTISIYARRFAAIYNLPTTGTNEIPDNLEDLKTQIGLLNSEFGTNNSLTNIEQYLQAVLGQIFIDIEFNTQLQAQIGSYNPYPYLASPNNINSPYWFSPLFILFVRVWQPRDNQDNLLMTTPQFLNVVDSYKKFINDWSPSFSAVENMQLLYCGNNSVPGTTYGTTNTVSAVTGTQVINAGTGCNFVQDMFAVGTYGFHMPIEIVDDNNELQTYHVNTVIAGTNEILLVDEIIVNNITNRSYRILGVQCDVPGVLDNALFAI
jgi:hypothetical protein